MNPLGTRARIEELARLLDGAVSGPSTLTAGPATLATRLRAVAPALEAAATPRPEFRAALRTRLVAVATTHHPAPLSRPKALDAAVSWTQSRKAQRRIGLTAGAMTGVIAFTGVGIAASRSLPGQPFYGLKRDAEAVQLRLSGGDQAKGTTHLEFAATRLREVKALVQDGVELALGTVGTPLAAGTAFAPSLARRINHTLADFDSETASGRSLLESVYRKTHKPEPLRILKTFSSEQLSKLTTLLPTLPAATRPSAQQALALVTDVNTTATHLLALRICAGKCVPGNGGPTPPSRPVPAPGAIASPSSGADDNGPPCPCGQPATTLGPTSAGSRSELPTGATTSTSPGRTTSPTGTPGPLPTRLPTTLPTTPPTLQPTTSPTLLPTRPPVLPPAVGGRHPPLPKPPK